MTTQFVQLDLFKPRLAWFSTLRPHGSKKPRGGLPNLLVVFVKLDNYLVMEPFDH
jgi:hypothetical protein